MQAPDPFGWVGSTINGQFAVQAIAGEGGFATVYRGTHLALDVPIAIKCLNLPTRLSPDEQESFLAKLRAEAQLLRRLSVLTANIVQAHDIGAATAPSGQWTPYIVMEWLEGMTLAHDLDARRQLGGPPRGLVEAIRVLTPAAEALGIAHRDNVSHRDVKPANLFLWRYRGNSGIKVLDFGVAKVFSETPSLSMAIAQTSVGRRALTPQYGAPEQFSLTYGATGPWTDVFAMALVIVEVASGRRALDGQTVSDLFTASVEVHHRPELLDGVTALDSKAAFVLRRALTVNPALRFQSMDELWSALGDACRTVSEPYGVTRPAPELPPTVEAPGETPSAPPGPRSPEMGEDRVCTVMLIDLSSVSALSPRLDGEQIEEVFDRCRQVVTEQVESLKGVVERLAGDCLIAVFGVPRATDNDAERAVHAALRIQAELRWMALPREAGAAHLGATTMTIHTGRVFARMGSAPRDEVVTVARHIRQAVPAGAIVIARDAYRQVANRFDVEPLAPVTIPGRAAAELCYLITGVNAFQTAFVSTEFHGVKTKLVGRAAERQRLVDTLETTLSERRARLMTLVGAPGVGRSRLLADFFSGLAPRGENILVLTAQCSPLAQDVPYDLAASLIRRCFDIESNEREDTIRLRLRAGLRWFRLRTAGTRRKSRAGRGPAREEPDAAELESALIPIEGVLGIEDPYATNPITFDETGQMNRQRIAAATSLLVRFAALRRPIVVLCDDLQWADDESLDLIRDLIQRADDLPLFIVGSARLELLGRRPDWGEGDDTEERVRITPLSQRYMEEMVKDRLCGLPALPPQLVRVLTERAEGNPLILEETLHLLVDAGVIEARRHEAWIFREERLGALALPAALQGIAQSRLDRLEPELREALALAAVVGRTFWEGSLHHLRRATQNGAASLSARAVIHELRDRQLIRMRDRGTLSGEREAVFVEAAMHEVVYDMLSPKIRRPLHLLVAEWLEQRAGSSASAAQLALHYDRGGDTARAVAAYRRAAAHASSLGESAEVIHHLGRASALLSSAQKDEPRVPREDQAAPEERRIATFRERIRLQLDLGDALRRAGRLDEAERAYKKARESVPRIARRAGEALDARETLRWDAHINAYLALVNRAVSAQKR
jgi:serine/threonine protein kinase/tetratricopeptide (TPR) repeat protein